MGLAAWLAVSAVRYLPRIRTKQRKSGRLHIGLRCFVRSHEICNLERPSRCLRTEVPLVAWRAARRATGPAPPRPARPDTLPRNASSAQQRCTGRAFICRGVIIFIFSAPRPAPPSCRPAALQCRHVGGSVTGPSEAVQPPGSLLAGQPLDPQRPTLCSAGVGGVGGSHWVISGLHIGRPALPAASPRNIPDKSLSLRCLARPRSASAGLPGSRPRWPSRLAKRECESRMTRVACALASALA